MVGSGAKASLPASPPGGKDAWTSSSISSGSASLATATTRSAPSQVDQAHALGGTARLADVFDLDADQHAALRDQEELVGVVTDLMPETGPFLSVTLMLMTPEPPRPWKRYSEASDRFP